jgi:hypothetical protein
MRSGSQARGSSVPMILMLSPLLGYRQSVLRRYNLCEGGSCSSTNYPSSRLRVRSKLVTSFGSVWSGGFTGLSARLASLLARFARAFTRTSFSTHSLIHHSPVAHLPLACPVAFPFHTAGTDNVNASSRIQSSTHLPRVPSRMRLPPASAMSLLHAPIHNRQVP